MRSMYHTISAVASFSFLIVLVASCKTNNHAGTDNSTAYETAKMDDSSKAIINRSVAYAGGYDTWRKKKTLSFDKKSTNYDTAGKVIRQTDTHTDFEIQPEFKAKIVYTLRDTVITVIHDGKKAVKNV